MTLSRLFMAISGAMIFSIASAATDTTEILKPFPEAEKGSTRYVIELPELKDESVAKVQIIAGKTTEIDCNTRSFGGSITEETVEGWGYNYYTVSNLTGPASTLMACLDNAVKEGFVAMQDAPLIRYNSKLPVVIYAPEDVTVKYRIWQADVLELDATKQ